MATNLRFGHPTAVKYGRVCDDYQKHVYRPIQYGQHTQHTEEIIGGNIRHGDDGMEREMARV